MTSEVDKFVNLVHYLYRADLVIHPHVQTVASFPECVANDLIIYREAVLIGSLPACNTHGSPHSD